MAADHERARLPNASWISRTYGQPADLLRLASVDCEIPLAEIYDKVTVPEKTTE